MDLYAEEIDKAFINTGTFNQDLLYKTVYKGNMAYLQVDENVIYVDEQGNVLSEEDLDSLYERYEYYYHQTEQYKLVVKIVGERN